MSVADLVHRRPGLTLYRYVALEALVPSLLALLGLTTVVLTQDLLGFSDLVVNRGLSTATVAKIAFLKAVPTASLIAPFAVLIGCLVALGRSLAARTRVTWGNSTANQVPLAVDDHSGRRVLGRLDVLHDFHHPFMSRTAGASLLDAGS